jgi:hypothetical protein
MRLRAVLVWIILLAAAVANGWFREILLARLPEQARHIASTLALTAAIFLIVRVCVEWIGPASLKSAVLLGVSWNTLVGEYRILDGRIWLLVPLATLLAPVWALHQLPAA